MPDPVSRARPRASERPDAVTSTALDVDELLGAAAASTGLADWGDDDTWRIGLDVLVGSLNDSPVAQRPAGRDTILEVLATRLHLVGDQVRHPEILDVQVEQPVIVVGLPRTGTTITYDLLALDPDSRPPLEWEAREPWPAPELATYATDPRIPARQAAIDALHEAIPGFRAMHDSSATSPAECNTYQVLHFASTNLWSSFGVPAYTSWLADEVAPGAYVTHERLLQQLQWRGPRGRWTLKSPGHLFDLEGLLAQYPDACIIHTHRDPAPCMASLTKLVTAIRQLRWPWQTAAEVGASAVRLWSAGLRRATESRRDPAVDARVIDVAYRDVVADAPAALRRAYDHFGLPFTEEHERRIAAHLTARPQGHHGTFTYTLDEAGLTREGVHDAFAEYLDVYGDLAM